MLVGIFTIITPLLSLYTSIGFILFVSIGTGFIVLSTVFMIPEILMMLRMKRIVKNVSYSRLLRHIADDDAIFVGEGWSFWLSYTYPPSNKAVISMSKSHQGVVALSNKSVVVKSGTTLGEVTRICRSYGKTLRDRSQFDDMTVGGAIKALGHGWYTRAWMGETVLNFKGIRTGTTAFVHLNRNDLSFKTTLLDPKMILLEVTFELVDDREVLLTHVERATIDEIDLERYHASNYRLMFISPNSIIAEWIENEGRAPITQRVPIRLQTAWQMVGLRHDFTANIRLSDGHSLIKQLDAIETASIHILRYINFELFIPLLVPIDRIATYLQNYHRTFKGRTELRHHISGTNTVALDVALYCKNKNAAVSELLHDLKHLFHVHRAGMHRGKFQLSSLDPIDIIP
jgi:hypothetical protein